MSEFKINKNYISTSIPVAMDLSLFVKYDLRTALIHILLTDHENHGGGFMEDYHHNTIEFKHLKNWLPMVTSTEEIKESLQLIMSDFTDWYFTEYGITTGYRPEPKFYRKNIPGYVYILEDMDQEDVYKIGVSKDPKKVIAKFKNAEIVDYFSSMDSYKDKAYIQRHFEDKCIEGDWFKLTNEDVQSIASWEFSV